MTAPRSRCARHPGQRARACQSQRVADAISRSTVAGRTRRGPHPREVEPGRSLRSAARDLRQRAARRPSCGRVDVAVHPTRTFDRGRGRSRGRSRPERDDARDVLVAREAAARHPPRRHRRHRIAPPRRDAARPDRDLDVVGIRGNVDTASNWSRAARSTPSSSRTPPGPARSARRGHETLDPDRSSRAAQGARRRDPYGDDNTGSSRSSITPDPRLRGRRTWVLAALEPGAPRPGCSCRSEPADSRLGPPHRSSTPSRAAVVAV